MNQITGPKIYTYLMIDLDTFSISIHQGSEDQKTEINPVGFYVRFVSSYPEALRLKRRLTRSPYLIDKLIQN
jgi:hypothetical protein